MGEKMHWIFILITMPDHLREVKMIKLQMGEFEDTRKNLKKKIVQD